MRPLFYAFIQEKKSIFCGQFPNESVCKQNLDEREEKKTPRRTVRKLVTQEIQLVQCYNICVGMK